MDLCACVYVTVDLFPGLICCEAVNSCRREATRSALFIYVFELDIH